MALPTPLPTKEAVLAFLQSLGNTGDEVYASLKARNVKGRRGGPQCPIEVVLNQEFGADVAFPIGLYSVSVISRESLGDGVPAFAMPEPVCGFIREFDAKYYPDVDLSPVPPAEPTGAEES